MRSSASARRRRLLLVGLVSAAGCASAHSQNSAPPGEPLPSPTEARWTRPSPAELITITSRDLNPSRAAAAFDRVADGVLSVKGSRSRGSGFVITRDGLALTNHHVVDRQKTLVAELRDGRVLPVTLLRSDRTSDVALIRIPCAPACTTVTIGLPESFTVGSDVYILGTPLSEFLSHTLTKGIVSGLRLRKGVTLIQTDAAINRGSSGGPIVNARDGTVIGIVSSKLVGEDIEGIGFGVAIQDALRVLGVSPRSAGGGPSAEGVDPAMDGDEDLQPEATAAIE